MRYYVGPWVWHDDADDPYWEAPAGTVGLIDLRGSAQPNGFFCTPGTLGVGYALVGEDLHGAADGGAWQQLGISPPGSATVLEALVDALTVQADSEGATLCRPLMPRHDGVLQIWLGGHSMVYARPFRGEADPAWPNIQKVLGEQYRALYEAATRVGAKDRTVHQRMLAVWQQKYQVADTSKLIPPDLPVVDSIRPRTTYSDNFNRADEGLEVSANWTDLRGLAGTDLNIVSQVIAYGGAATFAVYRYEQNLSTDDHWCQIDVTVETTTDGGPSPVTRLDPSATTTSSTHNYYRGNHRNATGDVVIAKTVAGTGTILSSGTALNPTAPYTIRLQSNGSTQSLFVAGAHIVSVTDTDVSGFLRTGMRHALDTGIEARWDNFVIADVATPVLLVNQPLISTRLRDLTS